MTTDIHIDKKTLLQDKKLIILQLLVSYCDKYGINKVRYSDLRRDCDEQINALTDGFQPAFGGSFDNFITELEAKSIPEKRLLERYKHSPKRTYIIPDIPKIKAFLQSKAMVGSFNNMNLVEAKLDTRLVEEAAKQASMDMVNQTQQKILTGKFSDKRYYNFMQDADREIDAVLTSYNWRLYYASPKNSTFKMPEEIISEFLRLGYITAVLNGNATQPLKIILEFRGIPEIDEDPIVNSLYSKKYCDWFAKWASMFHNYEISDEDKNKILKQDFHSLSKKGLSLFLEFGKDMTKKRDLDLDQ
jgi:hypothetical protein